jgi:hypothetical protein
LNVSSWITPFSAPEKRKGRTIQELNLESHGPKTQSRLVARQFPTPVVMKSIYHTVIFCFKQTVTRHRFGWRFPLVHDSNKAAAIGAKTPSVNRLAQSLRPGDSPLRLAR